MNTSIILAIKHQTVSIPYSGNAQSDPPHEGFVLLKGQPQEVTSIPAAHNNDALKNALMKINAESTPFFTVACRKTVNNSGNSFWTRGYIEFALNYLEIAQDSPNYFLLFEQFSRYQLESGFDLPVDFKFDLHRADLKDQDAEGYTACVWITTAEYPGEDEALKTWNQSVAFLAEFLGSFEKPPIQQLYGS
jgi:hypothetical protein